MSKEWNKTPSHYNKLDLRFFLQDKEINQVEMEDVEQDSNDSKDSKEDDKLSTKKVSDDEDEDEVRFLTKQKSDFAVIID
jgi:hypothetical protein